jgi:hypothetical protein
MQSLVQRASRPRRDYGTGGSQNGYAPIALHRPGTDTIAACGHGGSQQRGAVSELARGNSRNQRGSRLFGRCGRSDFATWTRYYTTVSCTDAPQLTFCSVVSASGRDSCTRGALALCLPEMASIASDFSLSSALRFTRCCSGTSAEGPG